MKIKILKKNNKSLFSKRGRGFYGRVFVLGIDDHHIVLQHIKGKDRTHAVLTYSDIDIFTEINENELLIHAIQRHYLKKYSYELIFVKSSVSLPQFSERDGAYWLELEPIDKQTTIDFGKDSNELRANAGNAKRKEGLPRHDAGATGRKGQNVKADDMRDRAGEQAPELMDASCNLRQLEIAFL